MNPKNSSSNFFSQSTNLNHCSSTSLLLLFEFFLKHLSSLEYSCNLVGFSFVFDICGFYDYTHIVVTTSISSCSQRIFVGGTNIIYGFLFVA